MVTVMAEKKWDIYELALMFASYNDVILGILSKETLAYKLTAQYNIRLLNYENNKKECLKDFNNVLELLNVIELLNSSGKILDRFHGFAEKYKDYKVNIDKYANLSLHAIQQSMEGYSVDNLDQLNDDSIMIIQKSIEKETREDLKEEHTNLKVVSFEEPQDFAFTKPVKFIYFKQEYYVRSWSDLYVAVVKCIQKDYPEEIAKYNGVNLNNGWRVDIGNKQYVSQMANPKPIYYGFYIMTKLSPEYIVKKITTLMNNIRIKPDDIYIYYKSSNK